MKVELVKIILDNKYVYKYRYEKYCCRKMWEHIKKDGHIHLIEPQYIQSIQNNGKIIMPKMCIEYPVQDTADKNKALNDEIDFCPYCGEEIDISVVKKVELSQEYDKLDRLKMRAKKRSKILNDTYNLEEYISRVVESVQSFEELTVYKEQIADLKKKSAQLYKIYKCMEKSDEHRKYIGDILRTNKIMLNYLKELDVIDKME